MRRERQGTPPTHRSTAAEQERVAKQAGRTATADQAASKDRERVSKHEQFSAFLTRFPRGDVGDFLNSFSTERILDVLRHIPDFPVLMSQWSEQYFESLNPASIGRDLQRLEELGVQREPVAIAMMVIKSAPIFDNKFSLLGDKRERQQRAKRLVTPLADLTDLARMLDDLPGVILPGLVSQEIPNPRKVSAELRLLSSILELGEFVYDSLGANHLQEVSKFALASLVHETSGKFLDRSVANLIAAALGHSRYDETGHRVWRINNYQRLRECVPIVTRFLFALNTVVSTSKRRS
jgi:hypothetical protein